MVVETEGVAAGAGGEGEVDGDLAAAFGVAAEVFGEEGGFSFGWGIVAEVVEEGADAEDLAGFLFDFTGPIAPDDFEGLAEVGDEVVGVAIVVEDAAVEGDGNGIVGGKFGGADGW